jgi:lipopolysaccharide transport system permease protein
MIGAAPPAERQSAGLETVRLQPTRGLFGRMISPRELWRYRDLALQIAVRDITVKYRQTALGVAWAILQPLGFMLVFSLFFGNLAGISSEGIPYPLFSLAALVPWTFFAGSLLLSSDSLVTNSALISKIYFPRIFIPAGVVVAGLVDLAISTVILFVVVLAWGLTPSAGVLALPLLVAIAIAAVLGAGAALSAVNVRYRDVRYVVPFAVQLWLFATPVAYPITLLDEPWRTLAALNPMVGVVEGFRWGVLGDGTAPWGAIGISAAAAAAFLVAGFAYFHRVERDFADIV